VSALRGGKKTKLAGKELLDFRYTNIHVKSILSPFVPKPRPPVPLLGARPKLPQQASQRFERYAGEVARG